MRIFLMVLILLASSAHAHAQSVEVCKKNLTGIVGQAKQTAANLAPSCRDFVLQGQKAAYDKCWGRGTFPSKEALRANSAMAPHIGKAKATCNKCGGKASQKSCQSQIQKFFKGGSGGLNNAGTFISRISGPQVSEPTEPILPDILESPAVAMCD